MSTATESFGNLANAQGLATEDKTILEALLRVYDSVRDRNQKLVTYYESNNPFRDIGVETVSKKINIDTCCSWPKKAVTTVAERSRFDGFVFDSGESDETLDQVMCWTGLKGAYNRHVNSELIHGCMFATVNRDEYGLVNVRMHTAETAAAIWDTAHQRIGSGFVIADWARTSWSPDQEVPTQVNLHLPGRVVVINRQGAVRWAAQSYDTPLARPMMEAFAFRPSGIKPFGQTRISKAVMSITDDVIRTLVYMAVSSAFYSAPQKYLLGLSDKQFDAMIEKKWQTYIGDILLSTNDEEGSTPTFGQLSPSSPEPYIEAIQMYAKLFSGETGVPLNSLGVIQDNPSSAEAIQAQREDICLAAEDLNETSGEALRNVALMAMAVAENVAIEDLSDDQLSVMAKFRDPTRPSIVSRADAMVKIAGTDPDFANTDVFYEGLGFDAATISRIRADKRRSQMQGIMTRTAQAIEEMKNDNAASTEEEEAAPAVEEESAAETSEA